MEAGDEIVLGICCAANTRKKVDRFSELSKMSRKEKALLDVFSPYLLIHATEILNMRTTLDPLISIG